MGSDVNEGKIVSGAGGCGKEAMIYIAARSGGMTSSASVKHCSALIVNRIIKRSATHVTLYLSPVTRDHAPCFFVYHCL